MDSKPLTGLSYPLSVPVGTEGSREPILIRRPRTNNPLDRPDKRRHLRRVAITFTATGTPRPQPRPRLAKGRVVSTLDANARRWIATVERAARCAATHAAATAGPLHVSLAFRFPTPKTDRHGHPHTFRPDVDNLAKLVLDCIVRARLIGDDAAVSVLDVRKVWSASPLAGVVVVIKADSQAPDAAPQVARPAWLADG